MRKATLLPQKDNLDTQLRQIIHHLVENGITLKQAIHAFKKKYVEESLKYHDKNVSRAAQALGIHRNTLYHYLANGGKPEKK